MKNKKGQVGLDTGKAVMLTLLTVGVIAFAIIIALSSLSGTPAAATTGGGTVSNETGAFINETGYTVDEASGKTDFSLTLTGARNATDGTAIGLGNISVSGGTITNATATTWPDVQLDYTFKYNAASDIEEDIINGLVSFFSNATTWFALLAVVVIILIIAIVIFAVNRFGTGKEGAL